MKFDKKKKLNDMLKTFGESVKSNSKLKALNHTFQ